MKPAHPLVTHAFGAAIFVASVLGGNTRTDIVSDALVETLLLIAALFVLFTSPRRPMPPYLGLATLALLAAVVVQLVPLPIGVAKLFWPPAVRDSFDLAGTSASFGFLSTDVPATLGTFKVLATAIVFFWACQTLDTARRLVLLRYFLLGWVVQISAGLLQAVSTQYRAISGVLPYPFAAGFFANQNHFAVFVDCGIPFLTFAMLRGQRMAGLAGLAVCALLLLAVGSRSGLGLGILVFFVAFFLAGGSRGLLAVMAGVTVTGAGALLFSGALQRVIFRNAINSPDRLTFVRRTWNGILDSWLLGSGYGTFPHVYLIYEDASDVTTEYANHAHNDYAELVLEGGVLALVLILAYLAFYVFAWTRRSRLVPDQIRETCTKALLVLLPILLQSLVEYPLRVWSVLTAFVYANAILIDCLYTDYSQDVPRERRRRTRRSNDSPRELEQAHV